MVRPTQPKPTIIAVSCYGSSESNIVPVLAALLNFTSRFSQEQPMLGEEGADGADVAGMPSAIPPPTPTTTDLWRKMFGRKDFVGHLRSEVRTMPDQQEPFSFCRRRNSLVHLQLNTNPPSALCFFRQ